MGIEDLPLLRTFEDQTQNLNFDRAQYTAILIGENERESIKSYIRQLKPR